MITILLFASFSIRAGRTEIFKYYLRSYADCMAGGHRKHHDCHSLRVDFEAESTVALEIVYLIFIAFLNFASLPFVIQFRTIKKSIQRLSSNIRTR